jgi:hypothetical protein
MKYIPETAYYHGDNRYDVAEKMFDNIQNSQEKNNPDSAEAEYINNLKIEEFDTVFTQRILTYLRLVAARLDTQEGVNDYLRLAESRVEFPLTLPYGRHIPWDADLLVMTESGHVETSDPHGYNPRKDPVRFSATGCPFAA